MSNDQSEEKTDPASERKLRKLREDGIIPTSQTGTSFVGFATGLSVFLLLLGATVASYTAAFDTIFDAVHRADTPLGSLIWHFVVGIHLPLGMIVLAIVFADVLFRLIVNKGFVFSLKLVTPSLEKVNPVSGFKNLFKGRALTEFAAALTRFLVMGLAFGLLAWLWWPRLVNLDLCVPDCALPVFWAVAKAIFITTAVLLIISVFFDIGIQRAFFLLEQRMTKTEVKRERKEMLGTPEIRQERNRRRRESSDMAGVVGSAHVTAYFNYGDRVIGLAFDPVKNPLPRIAVKSREARPTIDLIRQLEARGVPGMEDGQIVDACELVPVGDPVPRAIFAPLAKRLRYLLG